MKKIFPKKYYGVLFPFCMAFCMSFFMSGLMILKNVGFTKTYFLIWLQAWPFAFCIAFPVAFFLSPQIKKFLDKITY